MARPNPTRQQRPWGVSKQIWAAYGDHYPGGPKRMAEADAARERLIENGNRCRAAAALWARVHPDVPAPSYVQRWIDSTKRMEAL